MAVSVLIPFGGTCPHRRAALSWLTGRFPRKWQVVVGYCEGPWSKAVAVSDALDRAHGDLLVIHDADVWCPDTVDTVKSCETWAAPHRLVHRLSENATHAVLAGAEPDLKMEHAEKPYTGYLGGGITILPRELYMEAPIDPRFVGWGGEDESWASALHAIAGPAHRGDADLFHLWHPPAERLTRRVGSQPARLLARRYWHARQHPDAMRALLEEVTGCRTPST